MKEKSSKKESNKEEAKKEGHTGLVFAPRQQASPSEDLKINWDAFIRFFNATLQMHGSAIRPIAYLSKGKKSRVQALVNRWNTKQALVDAVVSMARSDFLNGRKKGYPFIASFIWLTESDDHFEKVLNGYYDNPPVAELTPDEQRQLEAERYRQQQDARRAENLAIEERIRAEERQRRAAMSHGCVTYEQYLKMKNGEGNINLTEI